MAERKASQCEFHQLVLQSPQVLMATWGDNQERLASTGDFWLFLWQPRENNHSTSLQSLTPFSLQQRQSTHCVQKSIHGRLWQQEILLLQMEITSRK